MKWVIGLAASALLAPPAIGQDVTLDAYADVMEQRAAEQEIATIRSFFGDADIRPAGVAEEAVAVAAQLHSRRAPGYPLPDFSDAANLLFAVSRALDAFDEAPLADDLGVGDGVRACRVVIEGGSGGTLFVHLTLLSDGAVVMAHRIGDDVHRFSLTTEDHPGLEQVCPDRLAQLEPAPLATDPADPTFFRPRWMIETADASGHQVLLATSPTEGPMRDAVEAMLVAAFQAWPPREPPKNYFLGTEIDAGGPPEVLGPLLDEEARAYRGWYERAFDALKQPPLPSQADNLTTRVFRVSVLPSFAGPRSITFEPLSNGGVRMTTRRVGDANADCVQRGVAIGAIRTSNDFAIKCGDLNLEVRDLDATSAVPVLSWLDREEFWRTPTADPGGALGRDGCELIVEGVSGGRYHVVDRWACEPGAPSDVSALLCTHLPETDADASYGYWPQRCDTP